MSIHVTVWNEFEHEKVDEKVRAIYPDGIHAVIAGYLNGLDGIEAGTATLDQAEHGLTQKTLDSTDVLVWWGHRAHDKVWDDIVERAHERVLDGMGLVALHASLLSKIFRRLMGTRCSLRWRMAGELERLWVIEPHHPIVEGIGEYIELPETEMYGERFDVPDPDKVIFISWFEGGEVFRSGITYTRGNGKIFYFRPGHETLPIYHNEQVLKVIGNACRWAAFGGSREIECFHGGKNIKEPLSPLG